MAVGDTVATMASVATNSYLSIQPSSGSEWVIHNIYHDCDITLEQYNGAATLVFDSASGPGVYAKYAFHVTNSVYLRVKNAYTATTGLIGYDGIVTK